MRSIGVNTWVWTSPLTDAACADLLEHDRRARLRRRRASAGEPRRPDGADVASACWPRPAWPLASWGRWPRARPGRRTRRASPTTQDYLRACIDLAAAIGAPAVCGPFYAATGRVWRMGAPEREAAYAELREHLAPVVDHARAAGVHLGIEPLNRYETSLVNTVDQALDALGDLLGPDLGLALDSYHLNIEERSSADAVRAAGDHLVHVQVCGNDRGAPGGDQTDWPALRCTLSTTSTTTGRSSSRASPPTTPPSRRPPPSGDRWPPPKTTSPARPGLPALPAQPPERRIPD